MGVPLSRNGAAEGYAPLRATVAEILAQRGLAMTPDQVLITTGSQQALDLVARALLDPEDRVVLESPSVPRRHTTVRQR